MPKTMYCLLLPMSDFGSDHINHSSTASHNCIADFVDHSCTANCCHSIDSGRTAADSRRSTIGPNSSHNCHTIGSLAVDH